MPRKAKKTLRDLNRQLRGQLSEARRVREDFVARFSAVSGVLLRLEVVDNLKKQLALADKELAKLRQLVGEAGSVREERDRLRAVIAATEGTMRMIATGYLKYFCETNPTDRVDWCVGVENQGTFNISITQRSLPRSIQGATDANQEIRRDEADANSDAPAG